MLLMDLRPQFNHAVHEHVATLIFTDPLQRAVCRLFPFCPSAYTIDHLLPIFSTVQDKYVPFLKPKSVTSVVHSPHIISRLYYRMRKYVKPQKYSGQKQKDQAKRCCQHSILRAASLRRPLIRAGTRDTITLLKHLPFSPFIHVF